MTGDNSPSAYATKLLTVLEQDQDRLKKIDDYLHGIHAEPYMPDRADEEYRLLAKRAVSNWMPLIVSTPTQALYVDNFRRGNKSKELGPNEPAPEWEHWQRSRLDARQNALYRAAVGYGHAFTLTARDAKDRVVTKCLSPLRTAALFDDPANDETPVAALTVTRWPSGEVGSDKARKGKADMWIGPTKYDVTFDSLADLKSVQAVEGVTEGTECPVTRFVAYVDLDGRTLGVVEPIIPLQDRINQTVFDLLVAQTFGSFKVRTVTGMAPPLKTTPVLADPDDPSSEVIDHEVVLDDHGNPVPADINLNARRFLFADDADARFGTLDETPLSGFIESLDMSIRHLSARTQTPPHHLLGQIANLSAEALQAAENSLSRMVEGFRKSFGESWERVFRLAAELENDLATAEDYTGETIWRDVELRSISQTVDALGKLRESLGIPERGLWHRVPGATKAEIDQWNSLADSQPAGVLAEFTRRAAEAQRPDTVTPVGIDSSGG